MQMIAAVLNALNAYIVRIEVSSQFVSNVQMQMIATIYNVVNVLSVNQQFVRNVQMQMIAVAFNAVNVLSVNPQFARLV